MTAIERKPTPEQREVLQRAMTTGYSSTPKPIGRLMAGWSVTTLDCLRSAGWVYSDFFIRDAEERLALIDEKERLLQCVSAPFAPEMWRSALKDLERVRSIEVLLSRMDYWITDAGKQAIVPTEGKQA